MCVLCVVDGDRGGGMGGYRMRTTTTVLMIEERGGGFEEEVSKALKGKGNELVNRSEEGVEGSREGWPG